MVIIAKQNGVNLENMRIRMRDNEELKTVIAGNNSETNKRHKLNEVMSSILFSYVNNRLDFYNKMDDPKSRTT